MAVRVGTKPAPRWVEMARRHEGREELRLSDALQPWLTAALARTVSKSLVRRLVIAGAVSVDGETVRNPTLLLRGGASVRARVDSTKLPQGVLVDRVKYLHQDADLLVVDKPAGLPMHAGADPNRPNLVDAIGKQLRAAGEDPLPRSAPAPRPRHFGRCAVRAQAGSERRTGGAVRKAQRREGVLGARREPRRTAGKLEL